MSQTIDNGSTNAPRIYRDTTLTNVAVSASILPVELTGYTFTNPNSSDVYIKFYNASSGTTTVGTTTVVRTIHVPRNTTVFQEHRKNQSLQYFSSALTVAATTGLADSSTTAPATGVYAEIYYTKTN